MIYRLLPSNSSSRALKGRKAIAGANVPGKKARPQTTNDPGGVAQTFGCVAAFWVVTITLAIFALAGCLPAQNSGPARDRWQHPEQVMDALGVHRDSVVADVGCGAGYFVFRLANRTGSAGRVYAEDVRASRLHEVRSRARRNGLRQVITVQGTPDDPHLPATSLDVVLAVNTFHEWQEYPSMLKHLYAALKPGGLFGLIDRDAQPGRPRSYYYENHRMPLEMERTDVTQAGFHFLRQEPGFTRTDDGSKFYFLVFQKPQ